MTSIQYVGPFDEVNIPDAGVTVKQNGTVDVPADLAKNLLLQVDNFVKGKDK